MKIVIVRFSIELGVSDIVYDKLNENMVSEGTIEAIHLEDKISSLLGAKVKFEQVYDSWEESGH